MINFLFIALAVLVFSLNFLKSLKQAIILASPFAVYLIFSALSSGYNSEKAIVVKEIKTKAINQCDHEQLNQIARNLASVNSEFTVNKKNCTIDLDYSK